MKSGLHLVKDKLKSALDSIANVTTQQVLVGIPESTTTRASVKGEKKDVTNAQLGYIHNFGSPEANIPPREFMYSGIRNVKDRIANYLKQAGAASMDGDTERAKRAMGAAGMVGMVSIQRKITQGPFQPLKPSTIAARKRRGRTGTRPLIDTNQLRRSITYVIRDVKRNRITGGVK